MLKPSGPHNQMARGGEAAAAQQRRNCLRSRLLPTSGSLIGLWLVICFAGLLVVGTAADDEVVSSEPRPIFKNEEFLNRKQIPDVQGVLQKPLNDKKFENLNMFLVILKNSLTEAGYQPSPGEWSRQINSGGGFRWGVCPFIDRIRFDKHNSSHVECAAAAAVPN